MREYSGQIIYINKIPLWVKLLNLIVWLSFGYSILVGESHKSLPLWEKGLAGMFLVIVFFGFFIVFTYATYYHHDVITKEAIYVHNGWRQGEMSYQDISEMHFYGDGNLYFVPKGEEDWSKRIRTWVPPSKLPEVIDAATLAGVHIIKFG